MSINIMLKHLSEQLHREPITVSGRLALRSSGWISASLRPLISQAINTASSKTYHKNCIARVLKMSLGVDRRQYWVIAKSKYILFGSRDLLLQRRNTALLYLLTTERVTSLIQGERTEQGKYKARNKPGEWASHHVTDWTLMEWKLPRSRR